MPAVFWSYSLRKVRTTTKPLWAALAAQSTLNWPQLHPWLNTLECTCATLRWLVTTPTALSGTYKLCKRMTGCSYGALIDLPTLTLKPIKEEMLMTGIHLTSHLAMGFMWASNLWSPQKESSRTHLHTGSNSKEETLLECTSLPSSLCILKSPFSLSKYSEARESQDEFPCGRKTGRNFWGRKGCLWLNHARSVQDPWGWKSRNLHPETSNHHLKIGS